MIKNHFPKRKNGSCDGITSVLPTYFQQQLDLTNKQHADELSHVAKQLEEAKDREAIQVDRNCNLEVNIEELTKKATGFEKIILAQEKNVQNLTKRVKEYELKCMTLNKTLAESEALNEEMTMKLQQYCDQKKRLMEEKEMLKVDNSSLNNRFLMEKSKYELLKEKQQKDQDGIKEINISLRKDLKEVKEQLQGMDFKTLSENGANQSLVPFFTHKEKEDLLQQLQEETLKCHRLEDEMNALKASQRDSGKKLLSSGQSLEQLETIFHKKSAECSALSIKMNTMQHKVTSLQYENKTLQERVKAYGIETHNVSNEIEARKKTEQFNKTLTEDIISTQKEADKMSERNNEHEKVIGQLKEEIRTLTQIISGHNSTACQQEKNIEELVTENSKLREDYSLIHNKLLNIQYEKSDAAKVDLQRENTHLKMEISKLKRRLSDTLDQVYEEQIVFKEKYENIIRNMRCEKNEVHNFAQNLQSSLNLFHTKNEHNERLTSSKQNICKKLMHDIGDLRSRILFLEEEKSDLKKEMRQKDDRISFMENETKELQSNVDQLNSNLIFSPNRTRTWATYVQRPHNESYYDPGKFFSINPKTFITTLK